jgi:hypothetical protein
MDWTNMETELVAEMIRSNPEIQILIRDAFGVSNPELKRPSLQYATALIRNLLTDAGGENVREEFRSAFGFFTIDMEKVDWPQIASRQIERLYSSGGADDPTSH